MMRFAFCAKTSADKQINKEGQSSTNGRVIAERLTGMAKGG
jgi:hypothetical protein